MLSFSQFIKESPTFERFKGWMSPTGVSHSVSGEHCFNHHPDISDKIARQVKKTFPRKKRLGWDELTKTVSMAQSHGYSRYGSQVGYGHYVHYDNNTPGGKDSALHALKHLNPRPGEPIHITTSHRGGNDIEFDSQGKAANHIRTEGKNKAAA